MELLKVIFRLFLSLWFSVPVFAQKPEIQPSIQIGAYYFDGWKSTEINNHLTKSLKFDFANRESRWGWLTSTQAVVDSQIETAAKAGISFFSFCWYYKTGRPVDSSNRALYYFNNSTKRNKLKFCLMVANHVGYKIGPQEWNHVSNVWLSQFKKNNYFTIDEKPLIIFFSISSLIEKFKSAENVRQAFNSLRAQAIASGFKGVAIAACCPPRKKLAQQAKACGFDILTGYNYHGYGLREKKGKQQVPISIMQTTEKKIWNNFANLCTLPYIPVTTLNWDPRPTTKNNAAIAPHFVGFSPSTVATSIKNAKNWVKNHPQKTTVKKIVLIYAWNEYGEGAYLTPSKNGDNFLNGLKRAVKESEK